MNSTNPDPAAAQRLYRLRFSAPERAAKAAVWKVLVEDFFQRWIQPHDSVLDLGCGYGEFLNHLRCARRIGVDLNPDSPGCLAPGVEFHQGPIADLGFLADGAVSAIFTSNVLEHLSSKREIAEVLREAWRVLRPGGQFIALGPNVRFLPGEYWDFWDHQVPLTDRSLAEALGEAGFTVTECIPRFLPYTTRSVLPKATFLVRLYLRLPLAWRFFGGQFLLRARKEAGSEGTRV